MFLAPYKHRNFAFFYVFARVSLPYCVFVICKFVFRRTSNTGNQNRLCLFTSRWSYPMKFYRNLFAYTLAYMTKGIQGIWKKYASRTPGKKLWRNAVLPQKLFRQDHFVITVDSGNLCYVKLQKNVFCFDCWQQQTTLLTSCFFEVNAIASNLNEWYTI